MRTVEVIRFDKWPDFFLVELRDNFRCEFWVALELNQTLFLRVKDDQQDVLVAQFGQLNGFLYQASLALAVSHISRIFVRYFLQLVYSFFAHLLAL